MRIITLLSVQLQRDQAVKEESSKAAEKARMAKAEAKKAAKLAEEQRKKQEEAVSKVEELDDDGNVIGSTPSQTTTGNAVSKDADANVDGEDKENKGAGNIIYLYIDARDYTNLFRHE